MAPRYHGTVHPVLIPDWRRSVAQCISLLSLWAASCAAAPRPAEPEPSAQDPRGQNPPREHFPPPAYRYPLPATAFELALSTDAYWVSCRQLLRPQGDYAAIEWLGDDDDNYMLSARVMRFSQRDMDFPLTVGVGLGAYGAFQDRPDSDAFALSLLARAHYNFATRIPTSVGIDFAYAPDITTFDDGERLIDGKLSYGMQLSSWASTFVAYRYVEVDWTDGTDHDFTNQIHVGVRLAW